MEKNKISVIIPVYNTRPEFLTCCVGSVLGQTYDRLQVILVDDGSSNEQTVFCLSALQKSDHRVHIIMQKNQGVSIARKAGIDAADGEFLMFVDSDDALHTTACEYLHEVMMEQNCDLAEASGKETENLRACNYTEELGISQIQKLTGRELLLDVLVENCELPLGWAAWGKLYRTEIMRRSYRIHPDIYRGEDVLTVAEYLLESESIVASDRKLYYYNKGNPESATAQHNSIKNLSLCRYGNELVSIYSAYGSENAYQHVKGMYCEILFGCLLQCEYNRYPGYRTMKRQIRKEMLKYRGDIIRNPYLTHRWKIIIAVTCPKIFYIQHMIRDRK